MKKFIVSIVVVILIACAGVGVYHFGGQYFGGDSVKADTTEVVTDSIVSDSLVVDSVAVDTIAIWTPWTLIKFYVCDCKSITNILRVCGVMVTHQILVLISQVRILADLQKFRVVLRKTEMKIYNN